MVIEIIVSILIFILILPIKCNAMFYINLLKNKGAVGVEILKIAIVQDKFKIASGQVTTTNKKNREKTFELSKEDKNLMFLKFVVSNIAHRIIINDAYVGVDIGKKDDAMTTAILCGSALIVVDAIMAVLFSKKQGFNYNVDVEPLFCQNKLVLSLQLIIYTNLFDILFAIIKSYLKTNKEIRQLKKEKLNYQKNYVN